jgi:hypothetical protein
MLCHQNYQAKFQPPLRTSVNRGGDFSRLIGQQSHERWLIVRFVAHIGKNDDARLAGEIVYVHGEQGLRGRIDDKDER